MVNRSLRSFIQLIGLTCLCISMMVVSNAQAKRRKKVNLKKACKTEISKYCKNAKGKGLRRCLSKKAKKRSKKCKSALVKIKKLIRAKRAKRAKAKKKTKKKVVLNPKLTAVRAPINPNINAAVRKPIKPVKPATTKPSNSSSKPTQSSSKPAQSSLALNTKILQNAAKIPVRPYCWKGMKQYKDKCPDGKGIRTTGLSKVIELKSKEGKTWTVAKDSYGNSYCSGVTYEAVAPIVIEKGWLASKSYADIRTFQQLWYVVCPEGVEKSSGLHCKHPDGSVYSLSKIKREAAVLAIEHAKIGKKIDYKSARPGDVVQLYRSGWGHSVLFKNWVQSDGSSSESFNDKTVGLKYFSSQPATNGVGDHIECFKSRGCPSICRKSCALTDQAISVGRLTGP